MVEVTNRLVPADDLSEMWNRSFTETVRNLEGIPAKIDFIQSRLMQSLGRGQSLNEIVHAEGPCGVVEYVSA